MAEPVIQFVAFKTTMAADAFLPAWMPFATSFLARGLDTIVLSTALSPGGAFRFISRNAWDARAFAATFAAGLPGDAGGFGITAVQAGAFRLAAGRALDLHTARRDRVKAMALVTLDPGAAPDWAALAPPSESLTAGWALYAPASHRWSGQCSAIVEVLAEPAQAQSALAAARALATALPSPRSVDVGLYEEIVVLPQRP